MKRLPALATKTPFYYRDINYAEKFEASRSTKLTCTPASAGDGRIFDAEFWIMRCSLGVANPVLFADGATNDDYIEFLATDALTVVLGGVTVRTTTRLFRDTSHWMHIAVQVNTTLATATDRVKIYVNGVRETAFSTSADPAQDSMSNTLTKVPHIIGFRNATYSSFYLADFMLTDGGIPPLQGAPSQLNSTVWVPAQYPLPDNSFSLSASSTLTTANFSPIPTWLSETLLAVVDQGNVYLYNKTGTALNAGSSAVYDASGSPMDVVAVSTTKLIIFYQNGVSNKAVAVDVTGGTITVGTPLTIGAVNLSGYNYGAIQFLTSTTFAITYDTSTNNCVVQVLTLSTMTLSAGTAAVAWAGYGMPTLAMLTATQGVLCGLNSLTGYNNAVIVNISGTTVTFGNTAAFYGPNYTGQNPIVKLSTTTALIGGAAGTYCKVLVVTITGTAIACSSPITVARPASNSQVGASRGLCGLSPLLAAISWREVTSAHVYVCVFSISGTTVEVKQTEDVGTPPASAAMSRIPGSASMAVVSGYGASTKGYIDTITFCPNLGGVFLEFKDAANPGTSTAPGQAGVLFTPSGLVSSDQTANTPTHVGCVLDSLSGSGALTEGNLKMAAGNHNGTYMVGSGLWAWKFTLAAAGNIGVISTTTGLTTLIAGAMNDVIEVELDLTNYTLSKRVNGGALTLVSAIAPDTYQPYFAINGTAQFCDFTPTNPAASIFRPAAMPDPVEFDPRNGVSTQSFTGTGANQDIVTPNVADIAIIKSRLQATDYKVGVSARGAGKITEFDTGDAEESLATGLVAFLAKGVTVGTDAAYNLNADTFLLWALTAGAKYGIDVQVYTGSGVNRAVAHNLGAVPDMILLKNLTNASRAYAIYHRGQNALPANGSWAFNSTSPYAASATFFNNTAPNSRNFTVGSSNQVNEAGATHLALLFRSIPGFSMFGPYTGTAAASGARVSCGFRPRIVLLRDVIGATVNTRLFDAGRHLYNPIGTNLVVNTATAEAALVGLDIVSDGFRLRTITTEPNAAELGIFMAFAEAPFPWCNAR